LEQKQSKGSPHEAEAEKYRESRGGGGKDLQSERRFCYRYL